MNYEITDDSGFLALVNVRNYKSFLTEDWEFEELISHFVNQMKQGDFLIWRTSESGGGCWNVAFVTERTSVNSFREFSSKIIVTDGKIYLTNYEDLTMAASYPQHKIPSKHNSNLFYEIENGVYDVTIRQLFNPDFNNDGLEEKVNFEIVIKPSASEVQANRIEKIHWYN